ncbi:MAG: hypothetical protein WHV44_11975, partial [Anaerolineales bacterium]
IIGNPPYVRKESISDPNGRLSPAAYKEALLEMVRLDFPDYFTKSRAQTDQFKKGYQPSGHSDLYTYFYIRSLRLLNPQGMHVFICSNSWLDVGYGAWLQAFFLRQAPLHLVIDNHAKRSFARADVNTIISVASAPRRVPGDHVVRFAAFKQPFEDAVLSENLLAIEGATAILKTDAFRVFPITAAELLAEGSDDGQYVGDKWGGKYLRAPDFYLRVISEAKFNYLRDTAQVLGYVHDNNVSSRYALVYFIKSVKDVRKITITPGDTIMQGVNPQGNSRVKADMLFPRTFDNVHLVLWNKNRAAIGKEFYRIIAENRNPRILALILNSTFSILQRELIGLHNLGGGAIKFSSSDVGLFILPDLPEYLLDSSTLDSFLNREINDVFKECGIDPQSGIPISEQEPNPLPDRKVLDDIVFDALGLTGEERKEVYRAVCQLVWERISKARSV